MTGQWVFVTGVRIEERSRLSFEALPLPVRRCLSSRSGDGNAAKRRHDVITGSTLHRDGYNSEEGAGQRCVYNISSFASRNNSPGLFPPASCVPRSQVDGPLLVLCYLKASFAARDSRKRGRSGECCESLLNTLDLLMMMPFIDLQRVMMVMTTMTVTRVALKTTPRYCCCRSLAWNHTPGAHDAASLESIVTRLSPPPRSLCLQLCTWPSATQS